MLCSSSLEPKLKVGPGPDRFRFSQLKADDNTSLWSVASVLIPVSRLEGKIFELLSIFLYTYLSNIIQTSQIRIIFIAFTKP